MTNAQKWVSLFLGLFIVLFILGRLTKSEEEFDENFDYYEETDSNAEKPDGLSLMNTIGCVSCHGADLKGTGLGPSLYTAKEYWGRQRLIAYLRNPSAYDGDERFDSYKSQYKSIMPSYSNIDVEKLGIIADYILSLEGK
ncbi:MAG: cytochrome c [Melioribacteraceae bacterium]|nr:cytochrome c [Melioribacteraceae bacterium]